MAHVAGILDDALSPYPVDQDGFVIPAVWQVRPDKWSKLPRSFREDHSNDFLLKEAQPPKAEKTRRPGVTRFSTQACIDWGRAQGWKLLDRERYDARLKRHHDLLLGADAMFEGDDGMILVQGAGKSERAAHLRRFEDRGGVAKAQRLRLRFVYAEFERGSKTPVLLEWWV